MPAPQDIARRLGNQPGDPSVRTSYEFLADGTRTARGQLRALAITGGTPILLPEMGPLAGQGVVERMRSIGVNTEQWVEVPRPARVTPEQAALLSIGAGDLVLSVGRTYYDGMAARWRPPTSSSPTTAGKLPTNSPSTWQD